MATPRDITHCYVQKKENQNGQIHDNIFFYATYTAFLAVLIIAQLAIFFI